MSHDFVLHAIASAYVISNSMRLCAYVSQIAAVVRDRGGAEAISLPTWMFWAFSHAVTGVYCATVANDVLLAGMTWGNCAGACAVAALTAMKRRQVRVVQTGPTPGLRRAQPVADGCEEHERGQHRRCIAAEIGPQGFRAPEHAVADRADQREDHPRERGRCEQRADDYR